MGKDTPPTVSPAHDVPALVLPSWLLEMLKGAPVLRELAGAVWATFDPGSLASLPPDDTRTLGQALYAKTPADAPLKINVGPHLEERFAALTKAHQDEGSKKERGGTLVVNKSGVFELVNEGRGGADNFFLPNLKAGDGATVVGTFHTHVDTDRLSTSESNPKGYINKAPGGGDIAYALENKLDFTIVKAPGTEFMLVRTEATPAKVDGDALRAEYQKALNEGTVSGNRIRSEEAVTQELARDYAKKYGLAYYEGKDGVFTRVEPAP